MASAIFTYVSSHLGWRVDCVLSGSMEPELHTGSLVVTRPASPGEIQVDDIITFHDYSSESDTITHRVIRVWENNPIYFQTKGDANSVPDPFTVASKNLIGVVCFKLPVIGYFILFLKTPVGFVVSIVVPTIILIIIYSKTIWQEVARYRKRKEAG